MADPKKASRSAGNAAPLSAVNALVEAHNDLVTRFDALLAKLDGDAGVTDTDYVAGVGEGAEVELRP